MASTPPSKFPIFTVLFCLVVVGACIDFFILRRSDGDPQPQNADSSARNSDPKSGTVREPKKVTNPTRDKIRREDWASLDNPSKDGWLTETLSDQAGAQLKHLGKLLTHPEGLNRESLAVLVSSDVYADELLPAQLEPVLEDDSFVIQRIPKSKVAKDRGTSGISDLGTALKRFLEPFEKASEPRFKFKLYRIGDVEEHRFVTRQFFAFSGQTPNGVVEQNATWDVTWQRRANGEPLIERIDVVDVELVRRPGGRGTLFADCTESVLSRDASYAQQILLGYHRSGPSYQDVRYFPLLANPGIAVGDVNGDGLEDLYFCGEYGFPNRLYIQQPDGTVRDEAASWGVDWLENSRSALLVDLDNDGDQDLVVAIAGGVVVAENNGSAKFSLRRIVPTADDTMSVSATDYNNDGRLDLYVCCYYQTGVKVRSIPAASDHFVVHDANNGAPNALLRNEGDWKFSDVTKEAGLDAKNNRYSFAAAWDDWDNDGDLDCYVANDYGRDNFYLNEGGKFSDRSDAVRAEDAAGGMSITWGDYDRDGWMDVFVSNMFSAAGNRITRQQGFKSNSTYAKRRLQRLTRGNTLLRNAGSTKKFEHLSSQAGVEMGRWAWGSHFVDFNNDGWEDLVISNGYVTGDENSGDL